MEHISSSELDSFKEYLMAIGLSKNTQIAYFRAVKNYKVKISILDSQHLSAYREYIIKNTSHELSIKSSVLLILI